MLDKLPVELIEPIISFASMAGFRVSEELGRGRMRQAEQQELGRISLVCRSIGAVARPQFWRRFVAGTRLHDVENLLLLNDQSNEFGEFTTSFEYWQIYFKGAGYSPSHLPELLGKFTHLRELVVCATYGGIPELKFEWLASLEYLERAFLVDETTHLPHGLKAPESPQVAHRLQHLSLSLKSCDASVLEAILTVAVLPSLRTLAFAATGGIDVRVPHLSRTFLAQLDYLRVGAHYSSSIPATLWASGTAVVFADFSGSTAWAVEGQPMQYLQLLIIADEFLGNIRAERTARLISKIHDRFELTSRCPALRGVFLPDFLHPDTVNRASWPANLKEACRSEVATLEQRGIKIGWVPPLHDAWDDWINWYKYMPDPSVVRGE